jgi:hypothetical protein
VAARAAEVLRARRQIEQFEALFPTPKSRKLELLGRRHQIHRQAGRAAWRRPHLRPEGASSSPPTTPTRATATSPRRWSTSTTARPADYEQLDAHGRLGQGRHRDRALRPDLARHQAQARRRARRRRLPHLLRPARRRLLPGDSIPKAPCVRRRRAARQRDGYARLSRRSADPGVGAVPEQS